MGDRKVSGRHRPGGKAETEKVKWMETDGKGGPNDKDMERLGIFKTGGGRNQASGTELKDRSEGRNANGERQLGEGEGENLREVGGGHLENR